MFKERCVQLTYLEDMLKRDVFLMCHNRQADAMIDGTMISVLRQTIRFSKRHKKAALIIQTPGGYADEAIYICKFFREYYDAIDTYIVGDCYSGGTIIALSSDKIYMNRNACLGPIDVQVSYDEKNPWDTQLYGMVTALDKAVDDKAITPELQKIMGKNPGVLATYFKLKYSYKKLAGEYVKKHCVSDEKAEEVWNYLAELNFSHGSSLTYKRCVELGLDVKRMPKKVDDVISRIIRDVEEEFGGLVSKSILHDYYETSDGNIIKTSEIVLDEGKPGKDGKMAVGLIEMSVSKSTEKLAIIETSQAGYLQERDMAITLYGLMPVSIAPIKIGWREVYNTMLTMPEQNESFEEYIDETVRYYLETSDINPDNITRSSYERLHNFIKTACYDGALEALKEKGKDIDSMSSAERWKAVVEYCLEEQRKKDEEEEKIIMSCMEPLLRKYAAENEKDFDALTDEEKDILLAEFLESRIPKMLEALGVSEREFELLDDEEKDEFLMDYLECYEFEA